VQWGPPAGLSVAARHTVIGFPGRWCPRRFATCISAAGPTAWLSEADSVTACVPPHLRPAPSALSSRALHRRTHLPFPPCAGCRLPECVAAPPLEAAVCRARRAPCRPSHHPPRLGAARASVYQASSPCATLLRPLTSCPVARQRS
jgi:hypothetical protein